MADYSVQRLANGRTLRQLLFALTMLAVSLAICWNYQREIYSRMLGPFQATPAEIAAIPSDESSYRRLFEMNAPEALRLPFRDTVVHRRKGRETGRSYRYFFVVKANPPLVLRASVDSLAFPVTARLTSLPSEVRSRLSGAVAPIMLDVEDPVWSFDSLLAMVALLAPLLFLGMLVRALLRRMNFHRLPAVAALTRFDAPVDQVVSHIDGELKAGNPSTPVRGTLLTSSWLTHTYRTKFDLVRLDDVVWLYSAVLTKKIYGLIPYWRSHSLQIADRHGKTIEIKGSKKALPELATAVMQRIPWIFAGHSEELEQAYRRNRQLVVDAVVERRQQMLASASQPQPQSQPPSGPAA